MRVGDLHAHSAPAPQRGERLQLIDALRAFALFGILQVNIQSYVWGSADPMGFFVHAPRLLDSVAYLLVAVFVQAKFIALFAFLFGFGFALQLRALRRGFAQDGAPETALARAKQVYHRRLWFLLVVGVAHGLLLYYGDVLSMYALCGFIAVRYASARPARLAKVARNWGLVFVTMLLVTAGLFSLPMFLQPTTDGVLPKDVRVAFATYTSGGYLDQLAQRLGDFSTSLLSTFFSGPLVVALFLLGALAARQGWLRHPKRHPKLWRNAMRIGCVGLGLALVGGWLRYQTAAQLSGEVDMLGQTLGLLGIPTLALYLALIIRQQGAPQMRRVTAWLAPAGRMPLTNYLVQSLVLGILLSGWGFGWGATLRTAELALMAFCIVLAQIVASRWWLARFAGGPMETLWRWATYRAAQ